MLALMSAIAITTAPEVTKEPLKVFIGDSRTVGMDKSVEDNDNEKYIAKGSMGYNYLEETAWAEFEKLVEENSGKEINAVVNFGVNDLSNEEKYAEFINEKIKTLPDNVSVSWASVNPVKGNYVKLKERIETFNEQLKTDLDSSIGYIDSYTWLMENGFSSSDGLHYSAETNKSIHDFWVENLDKEKTISRDAEAKEEKIQTKVVVVNIRI